MTRVKSSHSGESLNMPLVSVIIPVYNGEKTIRETLESVLNQTFQDFEVIIINDGSQDTTLEVINSIQDLRLNVFSYPNGGQGASRNRGLSHASGQYIAFLDADDLWTHDKLEKQLQALEENPEAALAYSWTHYIDESSKFLYRGSSIIVNGDAYPQLLLTDFLENGSNPLIRRETLLEIGNFDESLPPAEDWDLWLRIASRYHFVTVAKPQILYRISPTSSSSNVVKMESSCLKVIDQAFEEAPESLQYLKRDSLANIYKYLTYKSLFGIPDRSKCFSATRFILCAIYYDYSLLTKRVLLKVFLKIAISVIIPHQQAQKLITKMNRLSNIYTLMGTCRSDP